MKDISDKFRVRENGEVVLSNKARAEIVEKTIKPLREIYGGNILKNPQARTILEAEGTLLLCEYELYKKDQRYFK
jgi:hypothetical protein